MQISSLLEPNLPMVVLSVKTLWHIDNEIIYKVFSLYKINNGTTVIDLYTVIFILLVRRYIQNWGCQSEKINACFTFIVLIWAGKKSLFVLRFYSAIHILVYTRINLYVCSYN